ncbi:MAG TPA: glutamine--fructose-6-phosphate transaminase (isomerizing) [Candidatus Dormibacteraeota bacterium]
MCGIIGYTGPRPAAPLLIESLRRLEYRGYDSAGIAVLDGQAGGRSTVVKSERKVADLARLLEEQGLPSGNVGIGHTRWATHGRPTVVNAHPHQDCEGRIHLIHNGIIENYRELRAELLARGHRFESDTDTEVVPHLIEELYRGSLGAAVRAALRRIQGAYALLVLSADEPDTLVAARLNAPLVIGLGTGETLVSSDITALIPYTKRILLLGEGEVATARAGEVLVQSLDGTRVEPRLITVDWDAAQAERGGYPHFMLKEIHEQPEAVRQALAGRVDDDTGLVTLTGMGIDDATLAEVREVHIVACGTALHAGAAAALAVERLVRIPARVTASSEFRYSDPLLDAGSLVVAISQSGETADTLAAVREARRRGARVLAITNVVGSALNLEADGTLLMQAGPEIGVAATKTFLAQLVCGVLLALHLAQVRGAPGVDTQRRLTAELSSLPELVRRTLELEPQLAELAQRHAHMHSALFIGRGVNVVTAMEGALKLKEISYVHAEGYPAGELKHGPIALLDPQVPVVALATRSATLAKLVSSVQEVHARQAPIIALVTEGENPFEGQQISDVIEVPAVDELLSPIVNTVPLQLFAYHVAVQRGCDVDQPRNLAKSVTVE